MGTLWEVESTTGSLIQGNFYKPNLSTGSGTINAVTGNEYIIQSGNPVIQLPNITQLYQRIKIIILNSSSVIIAAGGSDVIKIDDNETATGGTITNTVLSQSIELLALRNAANTAFAWVAIDFTNQWELSTGILACPQNTLDDNSNSLSLDFKNRKAFFPNPLLTAIDYSVNAELSLNPVGVTKMKYFSVSNNATAGIVNMGGSNFVGISSTNSTTSSIVILSPRQPPAGLLTWGTFNGSITILSTVNESIDVAYLIINTF